MVALLRPSVPRLHPYLRTPLPYTHHVTNHILRSSKSVACPERLGRPRNSREHHVMSRRLPPPILKPLAFGGAKFAAIADERPLARVRAEALACAYRSFGRHPPGPGDCTKASFGGSAVPCPGRCLWASAVGAATSGVSRGIWA